MKNKFWIAVGVMFLIFFIAILSDISKQKERRERINEPKEEIHCIVCNKNLTNDYNRIRPNGKGYFCTPCYKATMRQVHDDIRSEGYD